MTAPVDLPADLSDLDTGECYALLGRCERVRYDLANAEGELMLELDRREDESA